MYTIFWYKEYNRSEKMCCLDKTNFIFKFSFLRPFLNIDLCGVSIFYF